MALLWRLGFCALLVLLGGGCASRELPPLADARIELADTPFHAQETDQCGPAALTSVLQASGVAVGFEAIQNRVYLPERGGSLQLELVAASRAHERMPVRIAGDPAAIVLQLALGRPVLAMQNLGWKIAPVWHYAVVVGYLPETDEFVLRSGRHERHLMTRARFERAWSGAERWAIVLLTVEEPALGVEAIPYLEEAAAIESLGRFEAAGRAYARALERWPDSALAALGLGNSRYGLGDLAGAADAYRRALEVAPDNVPARNNLAQTLADLGCRAEALAVIDAAAVDMAAHPLAPALRATRAEIETSSGDEACRDREPSDARAE